MLAGERRRAELPVNLSGLAIDHHDRRNVAKAEHNISVRQFAEPIGEGPPVAIVLDSRYAFFTRIEMLPALPLPHDFSARRHLHQVIADHLAALQLAAGTTAADL